MNFLNLWVKVNKITLVLAFVDIAVDLTHAQVSLGGKQGTYCLENGR